MKTEARTLNTSHHQTQPHQHQIRSAPIEIRIPQYRAVYSQNGDKYLLNNTFRLVFLNIPEEIVLIQLIERLCSQTFKLL